MKRTAILPFFWHHVKPYKKYYGLMLSAPLLSSFHPIASNYAIELFLDGLEEVKQIGCQALFLPITFFLAVQIGFEAIWKISNLAEKHSIPYVRCSILSDVYNFVQYHSFPYFQNRSTGMLISKIKGIADGYDKLWEEIHYGSIAWLLKIFVSIFLFSFKNIYLGMFLVIWSIAYTLIMGWLYKGLNKRIERESESKHCLMGNISDNLTNIFSILAFGTRKRECKNLGQVMRAGIVSQQVERYRYNFGVQVIGALLYLIKFTFVLCFLVYLRIKEGISIGQAAFFINTVFDIGDMIWETTLSLQEFVVTIGELRKSMDILDTPQENREVEEGKELIINKPTILFENVCFSYITKPLIQNLNLEIKAGEKVGIVGVSGAGKTSLRRLLMRFFIPSSGTIKIDGQNIAGVNLASLRKQIALIPQDILLFHRTILENITYGRPEAREEEVISVCKQVHIHEDIIALPEGYQTITGERGVKLSGGQRQRVAIARALLMDAPILVLDEATSSLDARTERYIQESLSLLLQDKNKTVLVIAHRLSTLRNMNRILVLNEGCIFEEGSHDKLLKNENGFYAKLWKEQKIC